MHISYISPEPKRGGVDGHASTGHGDALSSAQRQSWTAGSGVWDVQTASSVSHLAA